MADLTGKTLGSYRIVEQIGLGGMATVYKAYQPSMDRYVALKVLSTHLTQDPTFVKRFRQEAKVIAKLEHLHILPVYDHGEENGYLYLVMRFIEAGTLKDRLEDGPLSLGETRHVVNQIGSALEYAHQLGVVHRDLKPSNVLIDSQDDCYLTDFGIAKMVEGTLGLTGSAVLGTPHYMAPEQSQSLEVDHRADVYAMGVIIYQMVTGQLPFDADTPFAVVMKHISEPLPLPRSVKPDLPESVERVILKALAKAPADRYQSMRDLVADFDQVVEAVPAEIRTATEPSRAAPMPTVAEEVKAEPTTAVTQPVTAPAWQQWVKAQPLWILAAAALALVVLVLAGLILSRVPGRVEISGGQVQVVLPTATGRAAAEVPATPTKTVEPNATSTSTLQSAIPTETPAPAQTPGPTPTSAGTPTPTLASPLPAAVAGLRWEQVYDGEMFLRVGLNAAAVDPRDPDTIFAGTYGAGIYVSRDGGRTWAPSSEGLGKGTVSRLVIDPGDSDVVYAALFDQGGVYKSTDGGRTWGAASTGIDLDRGWDWAALISIDPSDSQRLYYAGATEGFYLSTNGGQRWTRQSVDCPQVMDFVVDPVDFEHIYAANHMYSEPACLTGVYESLDGGQTWELLTTAEMSATDELGGDFWNVVADPQDFSTLYAGNHLATHKSSDRGRTWTRIRDDGCDWLATNPNDGTLYCGRGGEIQISHDGGASWSPSHLGGWGRWNSYPFAVAPDDPGTLYAGSDGVMKSADGGQTWLRVGWLGTARMRLTVDPRDGNRLFLGGVDSPCETYRSEDGGQTWQTVATDADGCTVVVDPAQNVHYRPDRSQGLYRSGDNGQTWERFGSGYHDSWQLVPDPQDTMKLWVTAGCGAQPFLSKDGGVTFAEVESFPEVICGDPILLVHPDGGRVYVESNGSIHRSDDGGQEWRWLTDLEGHYRAAALDPSDPDTVYFGSTHKGVFKTTNGGRTWFQTNVGLTVFSINELAIDPANLQTVYAATDGGAFVSLDGGEQWWPIQQGLGPNPIVYSIAVDPNDPTRVYTATPDGIFRLVGAPPVAAAPTSHPAPSEAIQMHKLIGHTGLVEGVAWSPDGATLASGGGVGDATVILWDARTGERLRTLEGHSSEVGVVEWSPDGTLLASGGNPSVILWNAETGERLRILRERIGFVDDIAFSPDGTRLAGGDLGGTVIVWSIETGEPLRTISTGHTDKLQGVEWSPDGTLLATCSYDHTVVVWDPETGERLQTLEGHTDWVRSLAWSPVGPMLASGSYHDGTVIVWNPETGQRLHTLEGLGNRVSVKWSPDGTMLATGLGDGTVILWDAEAFEWLLTFKGHTSVVESLAWSPDGRMLASGSYDHTVLLWRVDVEEETTASTPTPTLTNTSIPPTNTSSPTPTGKPIATPTHTLTPRPTATPTPTPVHSLSGRVTDAATGQGIAGARVEAQLTGHGWDYSTTTGPDGSYALFGLPAGDYKVRVSALGYAREYYDNVNPSHEAAPVRVAVAKGTSGIDFDLTQGGAISGRVYQSDGVTPIDDAQVSVWPSKYPQDDGFRAITAADGSYSVDGLSLGNYKVMAEAPGFAMLKYYQDAYGWHNATNVMVTPPDITSSIDVRLDPAGSISGYIFESDGVTPFANVAITADTTTGDWEGIGARSNTDGSYTIEGLPPSSYFVRIESPAGFASEFHNDKPSYKTADTLSVAAGQQVTGINFTVDVGAPISGRVFDEETREPISGAQVALWLAEGGGVTNMVALPDGSYELWAGSGCYVVGIGGHMMAPGYVVEYWNNHYDIVNADPVCVTVPTGATGIDLYLAHAGSISGHVYVEDGITPLAGANVYAFSTGTNAGAGANSQPDGSYIIQGLPSGNYKAQVTASGYVSQFFNHALDEASATEVIVNAPNDTLGIDFALSSAAE